MRRLIGVIRQGKYIRAEDLEPEPKRSPSFQIMTELKPFVSPVDGEVINSRADRREHNKRNGVVDVGNDPAVLRRKAQYQPQGVKQDIIRAMEERRNG